MSEKADALENSAGDQAIESDVKLIATVGAVVFLTLIIALILVQKNLGASQSALSESVVPTQRALGQLTGAVGDMFLRQSKVVASSEATLERFVDRSAYEGLIGDALNRLDESFENNGLSGHPHFPKAAANELREDVAAFLLADSELLDAVGKYHQLKQQFQSSVGALDSALGQLMVESHGVAGSIRLEYVSMLRRIHRGLRDETVDGDTIRAAIVGESRLQMDAIDKLDTAVLRLGFLAGKVGLASSDDDMNSLTANRLAPNRREIETALAQIDALISNPFVTERVNRIRAMAQDLLYRVTDESTADSLASLRRRMLAEDRRVARIQEAAALASQQLSDNTSALRAFAKTIAVSAQQSANATVAISRSVTVLVSLMGMAMLALAGTRVRTSILGLRAQNEKLGGLARNLSEANDSLERAVAARTAALQLILDSTGEGLVAVNLDGTLEPERSRAVTTWFGDRNHDARVWEYLGHKDPNFADSLEMAFDQIAMDFLPFEVAADQAPSALEFEGRYYSLSFREVREDDVLVRVLVIIRDVTAQLEAERVEIEAREQQELIGNILQDRDGVQQTVAECSHLIDIIESATDETIVNRALHTLKGNSALVGFRRIAEYVHKLEDRLVLDQRKATPDELKELRLRWETSISQIDQWLETDSSTLRIDIRELQCLVDLARSGASHDLIVETAMRWTLEPTKTILKRIAGRTKQFAERLEKRIEFSLIDGSLRIPPGTLDGFWASLVHVVRNALDHGLEGPDERLAAGKLEAGKITISTHLIADFLEIRIADDGRGINWERVLQSAEDRGLPHATHDDLVAALFHDGLSTCDTATDISGRGVGLASVQASCIELGGEVLVESTEGEGSEFIFRIPWNRIESIGDVGLVEDTSAFEASGQQIWDMTP